MKVYHDSTPKPPRRFSLAVYMAGIVLIVTAFLVQIMRGECPVP